MSLQKIAICMCCCLVDSAFIHHARHAVLQLGNKTRLQCEKPVWPQEYRCGYTHRHNTNTRAALSLSQGAL
eukprot:10353-Heterococcus_DN1.PRE.1